MRIPRPAILLTFVLLVTATVPSGSSQTQVPPLPEPVGVGSCSVTESLSKCWFVCLEGEPVIVELWVGGVRGGTLTGECGWASAECATYSYCTDSSWPAVASAGLGTCTLSGLYGGGLPASAYGICGHGSQKGLHGSTGSLSLYPAARLALDDQ